ncbi:MAG TPA: class I SAM-dependent methyltransferase [Acidimicrobiales bacterium]|nr:class I SAM-dependent methyltransferase [Acidimicrobiales bacterium]
MIEWLERVIPRPELVPDPPPQKEAMQRVTRQAAFEPESWTPERAAKVNALFDELAPSWNDRYSVNRYEPLRDALGRGNAGRGRCLEVGSGTGLVTPILAAAFAPVIAVDLSHEMLARASGPRVETDANALPFADASFDCAVLVNAILFPGEIDRVLRADATVVWVNTRADDTPIYLPPDDVAAALPGEWTGTAADAALGQWCVLRRA